MNQNYLTGHAKEKAMIEALNNKKYCELNKNLKDTINFMFGHVGNNEVILADHCDDSGKPDIWVEIHSKRHYISLKSGEACVVHNESLSTFCSWLREHGIDEETINTFCLYHFGDGTLDGTGLRRLSHSEIMNVYSQEIDQMNKKLNVDETFVKDFVMRVVFDGNNPLLPQAEFIYHGDIDSGVICDRDQVLQRLERLDFDCFFNPHIAMIFMYPYARYVDFRESSPKKRFFVSFEWRTIKKDIAYYSKRYLPKRDY